MGTIIYAALLITVVVVMGAAILAVAIGFAQFVKVVKEDLCRRT